MIRAGGEHDLPDGSENGFIVIRADSTVQFFTGDSLRRTVKYSIVRYQTANGLLLQLSLHLERINQDDDEYSITVIDQNHLAYGPIDVVDAFGFIYTRQW